jgi:hypothetical protein
LALDPPCRLIEQIEVGLQPSVDPPGLKGFLGTPEHRLHAFLARYVLEGAVGEFPAKSGNFLSQANFHANLAFRPIGRTNLHLDVILGYDIPQCMRRARAWTIQNSVRRCGRLLVMPRGITHPLTGRSRVQIAAASVRQAVYYV